MAKTWTLENFVILFDHPSLKDWIIKSVNTILFRKMKIIIIVYSWKRVNNLFLNIKKWKCIFLWKQRIVSKHKYLIKVNVLFYAI